MTNSTMKQKQTIPDQIFQDLKLKIENNEWLPGDKIPSENELSEQYGVSRMSVRMSLQKLVAIGLLEARHGEGYFVKEFQFDQIMANISGMMAPNIRYDDFNSFRSLIELEALKNLEKVNIRPHAIKNLVICCDQMEEASKNSDLEAFALADYRFHRYICEISGNAMLTYAYEMVGPLFMRYLKIHYSESKLSQKAKETLLSQNYFDNAVQYHRKIVEAIRVKDIDQAMEIVRLFTHQPLVE